MNFTKKRNPHSESVDSALAQVLVPSASDFLKPQHLESAACEGG